jgi:iron-sulfur cluster repair protein YtfE (RIC family)
MDIDRFKHDHTRILDGIAALRTLSRSGVASNATAIAQGIVTMSSVIKMHLAAEDRMLYPALQKSGNRGLASLGTHFQDDMRAIHTAYVEFAQRWNTAERIVGDVEGFRADANRVLKSVYERMRREDRDFYPVIEHE